MKLTTKKAIRGIIGLSMALLVMGFATGCSKKLMPPEIEASNGSGGMMSSSFSGDGINEGNVDGGSGMNGSDSSGGSAGSGFGIQEQGEGFAATGSDGTGSGGSPFFEESVDSSGGSVGHAGDGPEFSAGGGQGFGSASEGMPGNGSDGFAPQGGEGSGSDDSFDSFASGSGSHSGGAGNLGEGSGSLDHPAETHHPFHGEGSGMASSGGMGGNGGMSTQEARLADFSDSSDLNDIHFAYDQYDLNEESKEVLRANAAWLKSNPAARIEIQGHCDERGTNNYNLGLGERRALSTKKYLTALGVDANRIFTISYGEEKPFCFDSNDACWDQNRRAHFMVAR